MRYIGKDIVTRGSALILDTDEAWRRLRSRARHGIRKAERAGVRVVESRDLGLLRQVWYDPGTMPDRIAADERLFAAYVGDQLVGAIIITPTTPNTLFCHYGGTNELGRQVEANAYLLWHVVREYHRHPRYAFLDVGVSFRHQTQHYFQKYCTDPYPIIFRPPPRGVLPRLNVKPFRAGDMLNDGEPPAEPAGAPHPLTAAGVDDALARFFGRPFTHAPNGRQALSVACRALELGPDDVVTILPSLKTRYVSGCVTEAVGDVCRWSLNLEPRTRAFLVIHEWGVPHPDTEEICAFGLPVIEDCAYALDSTVNGRRVGTFGDYAVFSFSKALPLQHGGLLVGRAFDDRRVWDEFACLDVAKRGLVRAGLARYWPGLTEASAHRRANWAYLDRLFRLAGFGPYFTCSPGTTPGVYMLRLNERVPPEAVHERMEAFGIECGIYHGNGAVFLPCHQNLERAELDYIVGAFRGMLNPCHSHVRASGEKTSPLPAEPAVETVPDVGAPAEVREEAVLAV